MTEEYRTQSTAPSTTPVNAPTLQRSNAPTLTHVWLAMVIGLAALRVFLTPIPPHDFWWHLATGRVIVTSGAIPRTDIFSYTRYGEPFLNQGWLAQVGMYMLYSLGGATLLLLLQALMIAATYGMLLRLAVRRSGMPRLSAAVLMATLPIMFDNWHIRPQSYALPLFVGVLVILTNWRMGKFAPLWVLPVLLALWVNIHGSFVLGGVLIALTFGVELLRQFQAKRKAQSAERETGLPAPSLRALALWGAISALALLLNPIGIGVFGYVRNLLSSSAVTSLVTEWAAPTIRDPSGALFFGWLMLAVGMLLFAERRPDGHDLAQLAVFFWLALGAGRNVIWFGIIAVPILSACAATLPIARRSAQRKVFQGAPMLNSILIGLLVLGLLIVSPWVKPALDLPPSIGNIFTTQTPEKATIALQRLPQKPQRLFHSMATGSYLSWAMPEQRIFIDTRIELYPFGQWQDYIALSSGQNADALIARYGFDGFLLDKEEQAGLVDKLRPDQHWHIQYEDAQSILLTQAQN